MRSLDDSSQSIHLVHLTEAVNIHATLCTPDLPGIRGPGIHIPSCDMKLLNERRKVQTRCFPGFSPALGSIRADWRMELSEAPLVCTQVDQILISGPGGSVLYR